MLNDTEEKNNFCVYVHTNKINGKKYVGVTGQDPEKRWNNGKGYTKRQPHMYNAIQKWGWDNFEHQILISDISVEDASFIEQALIAEWNLQDPQYGYNAQSGGLTHATLSDEIKEKISKAHKGRKFTEEQKKKLSEARKNTPLSEKQLEHLDKIKYYNKGKRFSEEHKQHLSEALTGREFTDEHKQNISNAKKGQFSEKQQIALLKVCEDNKGRKHTEEAKAKISAGNKGKIKKNSMKIEQCDANTGVVIDSYNSVMDAHNKTGISYHSIWNCVNEISNSAGGFTWRKIDN